MTKLDSKYWFSRNNTPSPNYQNKWYFVPLFGIILSAHSGN